MEAQRHLALKVAQLSELLEETWLLLQTYFFSEIPRTLPSTTLLSLL